MTFYLNAGNVLGQLSSMDCDFVAELVNILRKNLPTQIANLKSTMLGVNPSTRVLGERVLLGKTCKPQLWTIIHEKGQPLQLRMCALAILQCLVKVWKIALEGTSIEEMKAEVNSKEILVSGSS